LSSCRRHRCLVHSFPNCKCLWHQAVAAPLA
jgi:hypothetical protein